MLNRIRQIITIILLCSFSPLNIKTKLIWPSNKNQAIIKLWEHKELYEGGLCVSSSNISCNVHAEFVFTKMLFSSKNDKKYQCDLIC